MKYFLIIISLSFFTNSIFAQNTCATPYLFETGNTYVYPLDTGVVNTDSTFNYPCDGQDAPENPLWLYFGVCSPGDMTISYASSTSAGGISYTVWGPLADSLECDIQYYSCSPSNYKIQLTNLEAGYYKIMIANRLNLVDTITVQQTAGTAVACQIAPCFGREHNICNVSNNVVNNQNEINWEKHPDFIGDYNIQKETTVAGVYSTIGTVNYTATSPFVDVVSNPIQQSYKYRIEAVDSCGLNKYSSPHETIHLITSVNPVTNYPQLTWNSYVGFDYTTYYIYRGTSPSTMVLHDSISSSFNSYTDVNAILGNIYYSVAVDAPVCSYIGSAKMASVRSFSNYSPINVVSVGDVTEEIRFEIYPNPVKEKINILFDNKHFSGDLVLFDVYGKSVYKENVIDKSKISIDVSQFSKGYYIVSLNTEEGVVRGRFIKN